jgi:hypothetical protein
MQRRNDKVKAKSRNGAEYRELKLVNPGISGSPRSVVADSEKTSPRRERSMTAQTRMATSSNGENKHLSSPQSSGGPMKIRGLASELESNPSFWAAVPRTFGTSDGDLSAELLLQVIRALPQAEVHDPQGNYALAALHGISPRDTLEGMLATQMVAAHNLAMEFLRRAALKAQPDAGVDLNVNLATKLQRTFLAQMEALDRYRGKGEQKMNVEQVHIHDGAQGIVGPVSHQGSLDVSAEDHEKSN